MKLQEAIQSQVFHWSFCQPKTISPYRHPVSRKCQPGEEYHRGLKRFISTSAGMHIHTQSYNAEYVYTCIIIYQYINKHVLFSVICIYICIYIYIYNICIIEYAQCTYKPSYKSAVDPGNIEYIPSIR